MKRRFGITALLVLAAAAGMTAQTQPPAKVNFTPILGPWALEINAGDQYYYLTLVLKMDQGKLTGTLSEQNGLFTNVPLTTAEFDGQTLKFECKIQTPPDGAERVAKSEAKLVADKLQGTIAVPDLGLTAEFAGTKK
jgi:hypothetical protein